MGFIRVMKIGDIVNGRLTRARAGDREILIVRTGDKYYAIGGLCTHMKGLLADGSIDGTIVTCPKHGAQYDVTTGKCLQGPKVAFLKLQGKDEPRYETKVEGEYILVNVPD
jgi:3-phenylpropionate/trans-cinnamate dioxygenase ferredoxin component